MAKKAKAVEVKAPKVLDLKSIKEAFKKKDVKALVQKQGADYAISRGRI